MHDPVLMILLGFGLTAFVPLLLRSCGSCRPRRKVKVLILGGAAGVTPNMLSKNPGEQFILTAVYSDAKGKTVPLASLPVATEKSGVIALTPVGAPTINDPSFQFTGTVPADAVVGTQYEIDIVAEGDPTPGVDTISGSFNVGVVADEDTSVAITGA